MTLSGIISTKSSEVRGSPRKSGNKVSKNTFKNTSEDDLDTFCDIMSHLTSKYRPELLGLPPPFSKKRDKVILM